MRKQSGGCPALEREVTAVPKWLRPIAGSWPGRFIVHNLRRYFVHDVGRQAAALAYYLLFAIFPFLIFISSLLGLLQLDISGIVQTLTPLLPSGVLDIIETYLSYVSETSSTTMLWFSLVFSIYFPMRAANCLMMAVRRAYHLALPKNQLIYWFKVLLYTVFLLMAIALTLVLATVGRRVLSFLESFIHVPGDFVELWIPMRFLVLGVVVFALVGLLYVMAQDVRQPGRNVVPGILFSMAAWMVLSAAYSFYVENFSNYSVIYGALGTVIVLLIWLYLTATVLILGAEINDTLISMRGESRWKRRSAARTAQLTGEKSENFPDKETRK